MPSYSDPITPAATSVFRHNFSDADAYGFDPADYPASDAPGYDISDLIPSSHGASAQGVRWSASGSAFQDQSTAEVHAGARDSLSGTASLNGGTINYDWSDGFLGTYQWTIDRTYNPTPPFPLPTHTQATRTSFGWDFKRFADEDAEDQPWTEGYTHPNGYPPGLTWEPSYSGFTTPANALGWEIVSPGSLVRQSLCVFSIFESGSSDPEGSQMLVGFMPTDVPDYPTFHDEDAAVAVWHDPQFSLIGGFDGEVGPYNGGPWTLYEVAFSDGYKFPDAGMLFGIQSPVLYPGSSVAYHPEIVDTTVAELNPDPFPRRFTDISGTWAWESRLRTRMQWRFDWQPPTFRWILNPTQAPICRGYPRHGAGGNSSPRAYPPSKARQGSPRANGYY